MQPHILFKTKLTIIIPAILVGFGGARFIIRDYYNNLAPPGVNNVQLFDFSENVNKALAQGLVLFDANKKITVKPDSMKQWQIPITRSNGQTQTIVSTESVEKYLQELAPHLNTEAANAKFSFKNGQLVEVKPGRDGRELDVVKSLNSIKKAVLYGKSGADLIFKKVRPAITEERIGALGITALIGEGESDFNGSSEARIYNIKRATEIYDGLLVEPGREFSFNGLLGEVDSGAGYKAELVIKGDKIVPEYGGGICQVSTTLFRSVISSGLPITERRSHSLPVRYYRPQGFDATIYPGVVDLKFKNDTGGYILITADFEGTKLSFKIYGRNNDRRVKVSEASYYDVQPDGALKSVFSRTVTYSDGAQKTDKFYSSYKSPDKFENLRNPLE